MKLPSREENVSALRHFTTADGVHFTRDGYENLANAIHNTVTSKDKIASVNSRAGNGRRGTFFWRRFISPNGSTRPKFSSAGYSANKRTRPQLHKSNNKRGRKNSPSVASLCSITSQSVLFVGILNCAILPRFDY
jgi:hypothetical protein